MLKLLPNEAKIAEWNGITVTTSRVIVQEGDGRNDFSFTQFPVEDYRGVKANFSRSSWKLISGMFFAFVAVLCLSSAFFAGGPNPSAIKTPMSYNAEDVDKELVTLRRQLEDLKTGRAFVFFRGTQVNRIEKQIADKTAKAEKWIQNYNQQIAEENSRVQQQIEAARLTRLATISLSVLAVGLSALLFFLYSKSGETIVEIAFNNRADPVRPARPATNGKKGLTEAIEFVNLVEEHLNPFTGKLANPKNQRKVG